MDIFDGVSNSIIRNTACSRKENNKQTKQKQKQTKKQNKTKQNKTKNPGPTNIAPSWIFLFWTRVLYLYIYLPQLWTIPGQNGGPFDGVV